MPNKDLEKYIKDIGTPGDYSDSKYLVYVELYKADKKVKKNHLRALQNCQNFGIRLPL